MKNWLPLLLIALCQSGFALDESELSNYLEQVRDERNMPGLRAAIRTADGQILRAAVGLADKENDVPLDSEVGMPGGSTGKTFVSVLTMMLVEEGVLSIEDYASMYLGETNWFHELPNANEIQVKHLLSHSSGVRDYMDSVRCNWGSAWRILRQGSNKFEPEELIGCVLDRRPLFPVGEGFYYTDAGYLVLGRFIEAATGRVYYDSLQEKILDPLELDQIIPQDKEVLPVTVGYAIGARNLREDGTSKYNPTSEWTGGGLVTNPTMLVEFYGALVEGRLVSQQTLDRMLEGEWQLPEDPRYHYGYGLFVYDEANTFGHGGMWPGYRTQIEHFSDTGQTIAVQSNRDGNIDLPSVIAEINRMLKD
ncbi:MAG: serine hydrolase [Pseudomonadales bacterium]|nr:serine hydrolase [Pseudomonadales bacterium]